MQRRAPRPPWIIRAPSASELIRRACSARFPRHSGIRTAEGGRAARIAAYSQATVMNSHASAANNHEIRQGVVAVVLRDGRFLMIRRASGILAGGAWCFVGGGIERGESQPEAVVREFAEEVGAMVRPVRKIWEFQRADGRLLLHWWLSAFEEQILAPNPDEVSEIRWCLPEEVLALPDVLGSNTAFLLSEACREVLASHREGSGFL